MGVQTIIRSYFPQLSGDVFDMEMTQTLSVHVQMCGVCVHACADVWSACACMYMCVSVCVCGYTQILAHVCTGQTSMSGDIPSLSFVVGVCLFLELGF